MFCSKCGAENDDGAKACVKCGACLGRVSSGSHGDGEVFSLNLAIDGLLNLLRKIKWEVCVEGGEKLIIKVLGMAVYYIFGVCGLVCSIVVASKLHRFEPVWYGIAWFFGAIVFVYFGSKILPILISWVKKTETAFSSAALFNCFILMLLVLGFAVLGKGIADTVKFKMTAPVLWGVVGFIIIQLGSRMALKPELLSTVVGKKCDSPGEELIGIVAFFVKMAVRVATFLWVLAPLAMIPLMFIHISWRRYTCYAAFKVDFWDAVSVGLLPLAAYALMLVVFLGIDLMRAVLRAPIQLDTLIDLKRSEKK